MNDGSKKERKLSKAEIKRKEEFEILAQELSNEGYTQKLLGISESEINTKGLLVTLPFIALFFVLYFLFGRELRLGMVGFFAAIAISFVLIVIHEVLHGITWALFAKTKWRSVSFGFIVATVTPYCNCKEPMKKHQMMLGILMPLIILGGGFGITAVIFDSTMLLLTAIFNIIGCAGDLLIALNLLSYKSDASDILYIDHPYEIGTAVFEKN